MLLLLTLPVLYLRAWGTTVPGTEESLVYEAFPTDPIAGGRFVSETAGTESRFTYESAARRLVAALDVDADPAYYLSNPIAAATDAGDISFSAKFRVESVDDRASPLAFIGLMTTTHVGRFGDGLCVNISTSGGRVVATARIDDSGSAEERFEGAVVELAPRTDYLAVGYYSATRRQLVVSLYDGPDHTRFVGGSTADYPTGRTFRVDRLGLQNNGSQTTDSSIGAMTLAVTELSAPGRYPIRITAADVTLAEGHTGTTGAVFRLQLNSPTTLPVSVDYATRDGTARAGVDYLAVAGTARFPVGSTQQVVNVVVLGDTQVEGHEVFDLVLSQPVNGSLGVSRASATILNDDFAALSAQDARVVEGDAGITQAVFRVTLSTPSVLPVGVRFATVARSSATAAVDYLSTNGVLVFAADTTEATVVVPVVGDRLTESNEVFVLQLSSPTNASLARAEALGTIENDDPVPSLAIDDVVLAEGDAGPVNAVFTVRLSNPSALPVTFGYATEDGTATAGSDYLARSVAQVTLAPGATTLTLPITVFGDLRHEADETFHVVLRQPSNVTLERNRGQGTIRNDDTLPLLTALDVVLAERTGPATNAEFQVRLWPPASQPVTVDYATADGTALAGSDYVPRVGTLTFPPGITNLVVPVVVHGDSEPEPVETLHLDLAHPTAASVGRARATATIVDDDGILVDIADTEVREGDMGTVELVFPLVLSTPSAARVVVDVSTAPGTAIPGVDYVARTAAVVFEPGTTRQTFAVTVLGDEIDEADETLTSTLVRATGASLGRSQAVGIIQDDDVPAVTVADTSVREPTEGVARAVFTVSLSTPAEGEVSFAYATADQTARAGLDYEAVSGRLTLPRGETRASLEVAVLPDRLSEANETFLLRLTDNRGVSLRRSEAVGTILNDDPLPRLRVVDVSVFECDVGETEALVEVTLSEPSGQLVTVNYSTSDGQAGAGTDYFPVSGTVRFEPGQTNALVRIPVFCDLFGQGDRGFGLNLGGPVNALIEDGQGVVTIVDNDPASVRATEVRLAEGDTGITDAVFEVTLSKPVGHVVTVEYRTEEESATSGVDYEPRQGSVVFEPGTIRRSIRVPVFADTLPEGDERFRLVFGRANGANPEVAPVSGIIRDDDLPRVRIGGVTLVEGGAGTSTNAVFGLELDVAIGLPVTVRFGTANGTASAGSDYLATNGLAVFAPGTVRTTLAVRVLGDTLTEGDETFLVRLTGAENAELATSEGIGTIRDDDDEVVVSVSDAALFEGDSGPVNAVFTLSLSRPGSRVVTVTCGTRDGTAVAGADYVPRQQSVSFPPGSIEQTFSVAVLGDTVREPDETFHVVLSSPVSARAGNAIGTGTIVNDDLPPLVGVFDTAVAEGDSGSTQAVFAIRLDRASRERVRVEYTTVEGTASAGSDFVPRSGFVEFEPGSLEARVSVVVLADANREPDETFRLVLAAPVHATLERDTAIGTILNDDGATVLVDDLVLDEGNSGSTLALFRLRLAGPSDRSVSVEYATADGTATSTGPDPDYVPASDRVVFPAGVTEQIVTLEVVGDNHDEPDEYFRLNLSNPVNAVLGRTSATATLRDDDPPAISIGDVTVNAGIGTVTAEFVVTLSSISTRSIQVEYATRNGTALEGIGAANAGTDFAEVSGVLLFPPGTNRQVLDVVVKGNTLDEGTERFFVNLANPRFATLARSRGIGTILNPLRTNVPPIVQLVAPTNDATRLAPARFDLLAEARDPDGQIVRMEFLADGNPLGETASAPYRFVWSHVPVGTYLLTARATDDRGATAESAPVRVHVVPPDFGLNCLSEAYGNPFLDSLAGPEWTVRTTAVTPAKLDRFLGPFGNRTVSLDTGALPSHRAVIVAFDLYVIHDWQGNAATPNLWQLSVRDGPTLLRSTFANGPGRDQAFPGPYPGGRHPAGTASVTRDALGFQGPGDSVYHLEFAFAHEAETLTLDFSADGLPSDPALAGWGLDNVALRLVSTAAPAVVREPIDVTVDAGAAASFSVQVSSPTPEAYQWRFNGLPISGETASVLNLPRVVTTQAGVYDAVITNCAGATNSQPARLTVRSPLLPPTLSAIPDASILEDSAGAEIPFTVGDADTPVSALQVQATSLNQALLPPANLAVTGASEHRVLRAVPVPDGFGRASIGVTAIDTDGLRAIEVMELEVVPVNDAPTLDPIAEGAVNEDGPASVIVLAGIGTGAANEDQVLQPTVRTDPTSGLIDAEMRYRSPEAAGTLVLRTVPDAHGTATLTVKVQDDGGTANGGRDRIARVFRFTVHPVNDAPTFVKGPDVASDPDAGPQRVPRWATAIRPGPANEADQTVRFVTSTEDPSLFAVTPGITADGTLTWTPAPGRHGTTTIMVRLTDDGGTERGGIDSSPAERFSITVRPRLNTAPTVAIRQPAPEEIFTLGSAIPIVAEAEDREGSVVRVEFFEGSTRLGEATSPPYRIAWSGATVGPHTLTARATDDEGASGVSVPVPIQVVQPGNRPPTVAITTPRDRAAFARYADIPIEVQASDADGTIAEVQLLTGSTLLASWAANVSSPYRFLWELVPVGDYVLTARAVDDRGATAVSAPVRIVVSEFPGEIAIVRGAEDAEIAVMEEYVFDMGLSPYVFDPSEITPDILRRYLLVIWAGLGDVPPTETTVDVLYQLHLEGMPLYFVGDRLSSARQGLSAGAVARWQELLHTMPRGLAAAAPGPIRMNPVDEPHCIVNGRFGAIADFTHTNLVDRLTAGPDTEVYGRVDDADLLVSSPAFVDADVHWDLVRSFTQQVRLTTGGDAESRQERKELFQNVVSWLLKRCRLCTALKLDLEALEIPATLSVGTVAAFDFAVSLSGECPGSDIVLSTRIPPGAILVSVDSARGRTRFENGLLTLDIGHMASAEKATLRISLLPIAPGSLAFDLTVRGLNDTFDPEHNIASVDVPVSGGAVLALRLLDPATLELGLAGQNATTYEVQWSADLVRWSTLTNVLGPSWRMPMVEPWRGAPPSRFFRSRQPRTGRNRRKRVRTRRRDPVHV